MTTSLPESVGGPKNWDYRMCWIRDAALTIDALSICGQQEEVHAAITWLLGAIRRNGPDVHVIYSLDGELPTTSQKPAVPGYKHSTPVMLGNDAASQRQLGVYGDLFGTVADWVFGGHLLDTRSARELADLADQCADSWRHEDAGIWELPTNRQYTSSKMNCWRALDAAGRLADGGHLAGNGLRWKHEATKVRAWIQDNCWSAHKNSYTFYAGSENLDASVMLGSGFGFDRGIDMSTTIDAITDELAVGPLVYRYTGAQREEQTFIACAYLARRHPRRRRAKRRSSNADERTRRRRQPARIVIRNGHGRDQRPHRKPPTSAQPPRPNPRCSGTPRRRGVTLRTITFSQGCSGSGSCLSAGSSAATRSEAMLAYACPPQHPTAGLAGIGGCSRGRRPALSSRSKPHLEAVRSS